MMEGERRSKPMIEPMPSTPSHAPQVCARYAKLYTPLISDTMERMGQQSTALPPSIQCISAAPYVKMVGFAYPCQAGACPPRW
jgi:hypothetical protein